jgi:DNA polymerase III delta subunit
LKTHDVANALQQLAKLLKMGSNVELRDARLGSANHHVTDGDIAVGLETLVELARLDKQQWVSMIKQYGFPIQVRPADASRDVLGKLLKYLEKNPEGLKKLKDTAQRNASSPQLLRALEALLKE